MSNEVCGDNRFEIIEKAKQDLLKSTNIQTSEDEMQVIDNILFRCWQMGWLEKYEQPKTDWIPCEERLPKERLQSVIGWDEYRQRCCLVRYDKEWILGNYDSVKITHWQPLPTQPYKKEGAE